MFAQQRHLFLCIGYETVEHDNNALAKALKVVHMAVEIGQTVTQAFLIRLLNFVKLYATVHFQALGCGYNHSQIGFETALATKNVVELFGTQVGTKSGLGDGVVGMAQRHACGNERIAAMGNVGKRATMHNGWRIFGCLHQIGLYGIFEQHHDGTSHTKILNSEGLAVVGIAQEYVLDATAQVSLVLCKTKNGHQL